MSIVGGNHDFRNKLVSCDSFAPSPESDEAQHPKREGAALEVRTIICSLFLHVPFSSTCNFRDPCGSSGQVISNSFLDN